MQLVDGTMAVSTEVEDDFGGTGGLVLLNEMSPDN
jgi:hypothetical protein